MPNSPHFRLLAKDCRLKALHPLLTPAFPTLAHPTFNPFVFYRFQENRGGARTQLSTSAAPEHPNADL